MGVETKSDVGWAVWSSDGDPFDDTLGWVGDTLEMGSYLAGELPHNIQADGGEQLVGAFEGPVYRRAAHAELVGDLRQRERGGTELIDQTRGRFDDAVPRF